MISDQHNISRRNFLSSAGLLTAGALIAPKILFAQAKALGPVEIIIKAAATSKINVTKLRGNIFMLDGSGGNIAVLNGPEGKLLVDAGIGVSKPHVFSALNSISKNPIKVLINSHWHFDHTSGNEWIHEAGATIIGQDITREHLTKSIHQEDWNYTFKPLPKQALPTVLFKTEHEHQFNGEKIHIQTYQPAHTDCDSSIYFPNADILHVADTFWNSYYPMIDYSTGGSIDGMITAAARNVARTTNKTIIIPGHGAVGNRAQLIDFHEMLVTIRQRVAKLKNQGRSLKEVIAAKPTASYDKKWGGFVIKGDFFTMLVYKGV
ncbi:MBL fold metallo-hydrolase [Mucilaginibacter aquariorum]|uniref:MBL fold metallo-hydrolase n=1 Tax=Mucilaginibacter aquariorum TaxID=2967225 RepID=A0ABT1SXE0_9SPHI|nr:MBL fold metallo-hydrolase [Mucilaginibacter aquariorum]MCQ6957018.1 MBL fold metallo-hydrolase [Mucilaginibacter aquariorum]